MASGATLRVPKSGTRPSSERVREALFSALDSRDLLAGSRVLDLYAGSGALALEAISRGAIHADLVEVSRSAVADIRTNIENLAKRIPNLNAKVHQSKVIDFLEKRNKTATPEWHLVFIDQPYEIASEEVTKVLSLLKPQINEDALLILERRTRSEYETNGYETFKTQSFGDTELLWLVPSA